MKHSRFIEFIGVPGSGKTTVSHQAAILLREKGIRISEPTYVINNKTRARKRQLLKIWYVLRLSLLAPGRACAWFGLVAGTRQKSIKDLIEMIINVSLILELLRTGARRKRMYYFDQGLFQAIWSLNYRARRKISFDARPLRRIRSILPPIYHLIQISAESESVLRRLRERTNEQSRIERELQTRKMRDVIRNAEESMDGLIRQVKTHSLVGEYTNFTNDDTAHPDRLASQVAAWTEKITRTTT